MSGLDWREAGDRCAQWERWLRGTPNSGCGQHSGVSTGLLSGTGGTDAVVTVSVRHDIVASIGHACWRKLSQQAQQTPQKAVLQSAAEVPVVRRKVRGNVDKIHEHLLQSFSR